MKSATAELMLGRDAVAAISANKRVVSVPLKNGVVIIGSDMHYWPGRIPTMHRALVWACREMQPAAVILNGDIFDGASVSRHPPLGWEKIPSVKDELDTVKERTDEILAVLKKKCVKIHTAGNHDMRMEMRLAAIAPQYAGVPGFHLKDHLPAWTPAMRVDINDDIVVKHAYKGGQHAVWNNVVMGGKSIVTGHLHNGYVRPFTDWRGTRYGVDAGMVADVDGDQFDYVLENPKNWRSSFAVLTIRDGRLMFPELVQKIDDDHFEYRTEIHKV